MTLKQQIKRGRLQKQIHLLNQYMRVLGELLNLVYERLMRVWYKVRHKIEK